MRPDEIAQLSEADRQVLDALVEQGYQVSRLPSHQHERAERVMALMSLLDLPEASGQDLLTARTLEAISRSRQQERFSQQIQALTMARTPGGVSVRELVTVAAMVVVGISLLFPVLSNARTVARQIACQSNLASAGVALGSYGLDHNGQMPATHANLGDPWWETNRFNDDGSTRSNSAHLFTLARGGYVRLGVLNCSENPNAVADIHDGQRDWRSAAAVSFSYQNQYAVKKHRMDRDPAIAVLADKNPFFEPGRFRLELADSSSLNHEGGQNVLLTTGEVRWNEEPVIGRDNIFHAGNSGFDYYTGTEGPANVSDSFLVP
ncbi:MAG: hypothetical protein WD294_07785 [Phycisphaeraceae bacterium]